MADSSSTRSSLLSQSNIHITPEELLASVQMLLTRVKLEIRFTNSTWKHNRIIRPSPKELRHCLDLLAHDCRIYESLYRPKRELSSDEAALFDNVTHRLLAELCGVLVFDTLGIGGDRFHSGEYSVSVTHRNAARELEVWRQDFIALSSRISARTIKVSSESGCIHATPGTMASIKLYKLERSLFSSKVAARLMCGFYKPIKELLRSVDVLLESQQAQLTLSITSVWLPTPTPTSSPSKQCTVNTGLSP